MNLNRRFYEQTGEHADAGQGADAGATAAAAAAAAAALAGQSTEGKVADGDAAGAEGGAGKEEAKEAVKDIAATWPADWRTQMAKGDEKMLKQLERYTSPNDVWDKAKALETRVSKGELKAVVPFPDKGTPEQQTAWRLENGIPEAPDKYTINLGEGVVMGENDKAIADDFLKALHSKNMPAGLANETLKWYMDFAQRQEEARYDGDKKAQQEFEDSMRAEWGNEYRPNLNAVHALLDLAPEGVKGRFLEGRAADGKPFGSDPATLRWLAGLARQINPITTLVPNAGANINEAIGDELAKLEGLMANKGSEYWKGPMAEKNQSRYRQLIDAQNSQKGRG